MHEIDFRPVESSAGIASTKSGDAIAIRFTPDTGGPPKIVIIDGGFTDHGKDLVDHVVNVYRTRRVHLVISTHPDRDHIGGLSTVLEELDVDELLLHQPRLHARGVSSFSNLEAIDNLVQVATDNGVQITSPFTGLRRFHGHLQILGPTQEYYEQLVEQHLAEAALGQKAAAREGISLSNLFPRAASVWDNIVAHLPIETLTDDVVTGPRNNTSVITLLQVGGQRLLFTGDAGIPALTAAADRYESTVGPFSDLPLTFLQVPHHGSRNNLGPTILDRVLGPREGVPFGETSAMISAAKVAPKHPSPKVVNALIRRGATVVATLGTPVCHFHGELDRDGWSPARPLPAQNETGTDDE